MLNLLPETLKRKLIREYHFRIAIISLSFLFIAIACSTSFLVPSFYLSGSKIKVSNEKMDALLKANALSERESPETILQNAKKEVGLLAGAQNSVSIKDLVLTVLRDRPNGIKLSNFSYDSNATALVIGGTASGREILLSFVKKIQGERVFSSVDFPVSNFAKDSNIEFSLTAHIK